MKYGSLGTVGSNGRCFCSRGIKQVMIVDVCAHITGTVWKIQTQVGAQVNEEDTLVILESMKMEMPVEASDAGTVKEILVEESQAVDEGDVLLRLELEQ